MYIQVGRYAHDKGEKKNTNLYDVICLTKIDKSRMRDEEEKTIVYHAVAERTVMLSRDVSFSSCSDIGRSHEISYIIVVPSSNDNRKMRKHENERKRKKDATKQQSIGCYYHINLLSARQMLGKYTAIHFIGLYI